MALTINGSKNLHLHHPAVVPEDLIIRIFINLPVKSLLVFKSVCKSWRHLINNPYFIKTHLARSSTKTRSGSGSSQFMVIDNYVNVDDRLIELYILNSELGPAATVPSSSSSSSSLSPILMDTKRIIELPPYHVIRGCSPQTCHGLVTFTVYPTTITDFPRNCRIVVMNPATREFHRLPWFSELVGLSGSSYILFDPSSCTYKVLWLSRRDAFNSWHFCVISLGRDDVLWRKVAVPDDLGMNECWVFPNSVNGISYYFPSLLQIPFPGWIIDKVSLLIFDAERENFLAINFLGVDGLTDAWSMGSAAFRGSIYAFFICKNTTKVIDVWVMKDCAGVMSSRTKLWIKENSFDSPFYEWDFLCGISILAVINDGIVMKLWGYLKNETSTYAIYDPTKKVLRKYKIADEILKCSKELGEDPEWVDYVESLVSPKHGYR